MAINVFIPKFHTDEILEEMKICLEKGWTGLGFKTIEFEEAWKNYTGLSNAHFLSSNTVGLHLAVRVLKKKYNWMDGNEVITTPFTFVSTNHAILYENLKPVFADIDDYLCLDPLSVKKRITEKTKAVMFVGIGGNTGQLNEIIKLCKENNLKLILDAAHMAGTKLNGKHVGTETDVTVFSYQAVKNLPSADSGMICFKEKEFDDYVRRLSWLGISKDTYQRFNNKNKSYRWKYDVPEIGYKYHGNSIIASIALVQLRYLEEDNAYRNTLAKKYNDLLKNIDEVEIIKTAPGCENSRHLFQICVQKRDEILEYFYKNDIYPGVHYQDNTEFKMYSYAHGTCPNAVKKSSEIMSLPLHLNMSFEDVEKVVEILKEAIKDTYYGK